MNNVYLPISSVNDYSCYVVQNSTTIRAYTNMPRANSSSSYTDFFTDNHYLQMNGTQTWGNTTSLPSCNLNGHITNNYWYSNEFPGALFIFICICFFIYLILKILFIPLGRWLHVD